MTDYVTDHVIIRFYDITSLYLALKIVSILFYFKDIKDKKAPKYV